ncbi:MAG: RluA family pseudouridine synthase [Chromatiales bacterium]|nr:MAG: RluA family pseudouridine synthase [Chromatiales bacterium]
MSDGPATGGVQRIRVDEDDAGRRLDNFLLSRFKGLPRSRVYRMIRGGEVRVNGGRARPDRRLQAGDELRLPPVRLAPPRSPPPDAPERGRWLADRVLYEDRDLLVIDKPAGLAVHGGSGISLGAIELLRATRQDDNLELVHRLDRETSGCLLIAKRRPALRRLHAQLRDGTVRKLYVALLVGQLRGPERIVDDPLLTTQRRGGERYVTVAAGGKPARSRFRPREVLSRCTLCDVQIDTGRTHQIRVHAAHIGHPVAGDDRYGTGVDPAVRKGKLQRLFLHASSLSFDSPSGERVINVQCALPAELEQVLEKLRGRS